MMKVELVPQRSVKKILDNEDFHIIPYWPTLAKVQKIPLVKNMYIWILIVPILAKALIGLEGIAEVTIFKYTFNLGLGLPFSWKIFFYSALSFSVGNLIFLWKCYPIIKDHHDFKSFSDSGKSLEQLSDYVTRMGYSILLPESYHNLPMMEKAEISKSVCRDMFWQAYEGGSRGKYFWRVLCSIFYLIGFALFSVILYQNIVAVIKTTF